MVGCARVDIGGGGTPIPADLHRVRVNGPCFDWLPATFPAVLEGGGPLCVLSRYISQSFAVPLAALRADLLTLSY